MNLQIRLIQFQIFEPVLEDVHHTGISVIVTLTGTLLTRFIMMDFPILCTLRGNR